MTVKSTMFFSGGPPVARLSTSVQAPSCSTKQECNKLILEDLDQVCNEHHVHNDAPLPLGRDGVDVIHQVHDGLRGRLLHVLLLNRRDRVPVVLHDMLHERKPLLSEAGYQLVPGAPDHLHLRMLGARHSRGGTVGWVSKITNSP